MPGEFEPHKQCWMLWPSRPDTWRQLAQPAQHAFAQVARTISSLEPVTVGASASLLHTARLMLPAHIQVLEIESNDAWMRDVGPTFLVDDYGNVRGVDWEFNAWGGIYPDYTLDNQVAAQVLEIANLAGYRTSGFVLEGGSFHVDGQGSLITTEECLLNPNRNPGLSRSQIETWLCEYLNVETIIWLSRGVNHDETSGHIDNLCCFIRPGVVALTWCDNPSDPMYEISREAYEQLSLSQDARGRRLQIHTIHQPAPMFITPAESLGILSSPGTLARPAGTRLAGSYVNFYIANGGLVVPIFEDKYDQPALATLQALFPERRVIGIPGREILLGGGNIHCITQQQPQGRVIS